MGISPKCVSAKIFIDWGSLRIFAKQTNWCFAELEDTTPSIDKLLMLTVCRPGDAGAAAAGDRRGGARVPPHHAPLPHLVLEAAGECL